MSRILTTGKLSQNIALTPENYLLCLNVPLARVGIQQYLESENLSDINGKRIKGKNGWINVSKSADVLFNEDTIRSFENKPVTIGHEMLDPKNWRQAAVGTAINVRRGEGPLSNNLLADLLITDQTGIDAIKQGLREISLGYEATYIDDGDGKAHQTSMIGNHIAIVSRGKAGKFCRIYDSLDDIIEANKKADFMFWKNKIKEDLNKAVDALSEKDLSENTGSDPALETKAETKDALPMQQPPQPPAAAPQTPAAPAQQPQTPQAQQPQSAIMQLSAKMDEILKTLKTIVPPQPAQQQPPQPPAAPAAPVKVSIDPNKQTS